ncbi:TPA: SRPBCC family protein [Salmonella enterica]|uniref:SRPBCC family protein n=1 Tax=Salmonella enterica TaxID=28901 RepID=A0A754BB44_SALER|nr:SRPBCC family protein [Salmonella enterica]ECU9164115.1 SRPBCC family protein [Salmonella enterica subsp. enterica serovar Newport str. CFSAN000599]EDU1196815.1 SRPBCC family protein [Salmonella enterica subsp. enterica serovar Heidelberg str. CFSAN000576]HAF8580916.1 SRPBCC family protein [Salmonella enterica]
MTTNNCNAFIFNHSVDIPAAVAPHVWAAWSELMNWHRWDVSLQGTDAVDNGLTLGKRFAVIPDGGPGAITVNVTALVEGTHFTTTAISPMGLISFGHTLTLSKDRQSVQLQHSICAIPTENGTTLPPPLLEKLRTDVINSVQRLATFALQEAGLE